MEEIFSIINLSKMEKFNDLSFEKLPKAIEKLLNEVDEIKKLLAPRGEPPAEKLSVRKAIDFLKEKGFMISESQLYKLTSSKQIPFYKFGTRLVFESKELDNWANSRLGKDTKVDAVEIVKSASKKLMFKNKVYGK